jgi:hypothetical protein
MNARLFITSLLMLTNLTLFGAYGAFNPANPAIGGQIIVPQYVVNQGPIAPAQNVVANPAVAGQPGLPNLFTLNQIQQGYAAQATNDLKAQYISYILDNNDNNFTIGQKIAQTQNLATIIAHDISLYSGWLYNTDQAQVDWLKEQKTRIAHRLSRLQWQATHWGVRALWNTAIIGTCCFAALLLASIGQEQYKRFDPNYKLQTVGELAWMPIEGILNIAQDAIIATKDIITGETAQQNVKMGVGMTIAAIKTAGNIGSEALSAVATKGIDRVQSDLHDLAEYTYKNTQDPPLWSEAFKEFWYPKDQSGNDKSDNNSKGSIVSITKPKPTAVEVAKQAAAKVVKPIGFMDWLYSQTPLPEIAKNNEITATAKWRSDYNEYEKDLEAQRFKEKQAKKQLQQDCAIELQRLKDLHRPNAEAKAQEMLAKIAEESAHDKSYLSIQGDKLGQEMPKAVLAEMEDNKNGKKR